MPDDIRVLIIEDNYLIREAIKDCTAGLTCSFTEAEDEREALSHIGSQDFDVIFLDVGLPEADGLETLRMAKELRPDLPPVVILTGYLDEARRRKAEEIGVFEYLTKNQLSTPAITRVIALALNVTAKRHAKEN
jgi:CheY-like chemotaxis protein